MPRRRAVPPLSANAAMRWAVVEQLTAALSPATILEIGCGEGAFGARLAGRGAYLGVEPDRVAFETARRRIEGRGGEVRNIGWDELGSDRTFDLVCAFEVLEHLADDRSALEGWQRLLAPGGTLVVSMPAWPERFNAWDARVGHHRRYRPDATADLLRLAGYREPHVVVYGWPLGYALEAGRSALAAASSRRPGGIPSPPMAARTAGSGRTLQPPEGVGRLFEVAAAPFVALQRRRPDRGTGLVARAVRGRGDRHDGGCTG